MHLMHRGPSTESLTGDSSGGWYPGVEPILSPGGMAVPKGVLPAHSLWQPDITMMINFAILAQVFVKKHRWL